MPMHIPLQAGPDARRGPATGHPAGPRGRHAGAVPRDRAGRAPDVWQVDVGAHAGTVGRAPAVQPSVPPPDRPLAPADRPGPPPA